MIEILLLTSGLISLILLAIVVFWLFSSVIFLIGGDSSETDEEKITKNVREYIRDKHNIVI